jgi:hypothetical protein
MLFGFLEDLELLLLLLLQGALRLIRKLLPYSLVHIDPPPVSGSVPLCGRADRVPKVIVTHIYCLSPRRRHLCGRWRNVALRRKPAFQWSATDWARFLASRPPLLHAVEMESVPAV